MINEECNSIFNFIWEEIDQFEDKITVNQIELINSLDKDLREYLYAQTDFLAERLVEEMLKQGYLEDGIYKHDFEKVKDGLSCWIQFPKESMKNVLKTGVNMRIKYIFAPVDTLTNFVFGGGEKLDTYDILIKAAYLPADPFTKALWNKIKEKEEEKLKYAITSEQFTELAKEIHSNYRQQLSVAQLIEPLRYYCVFARKESVHIDLLALFFESYDLSGIYSEIRNIAEKNSINAFTCDELEDMLNQIMDEHGDMPLSHEENTQDIPQNIEEETPDSDEEIDVTIEDTTLQESIAAQEALEPTEDIYEDTEEMQDENEAEKTHEDAESISGESDFQAEDIMPKEVMADENIPYDIQDDTADVPANENNEHELVIKDADVIHSELMDSLNRMRANHRSPLEIEIEYFAAEQQNIRNFHRKILANY